MDSKHGKLVSPKTKAMKRVHYRDRSYHKRADCMTKDLPIGTNLALLQFLWMLVSGALLPNRGAIFPALKSIGLSDAATRRPGRRFARAPGRCVVWAGTARVVH